MRNLSLPFALSLAALWPSATVAQPQTDSPQNAYDFRERTWQIAFETGNFFEGVRKDQLFMSIVYEGDDYRFPVYAIAIRKGCTAADTGDTRKACGNRMIARMVRSPSSGPSTRPRASGAALYGTLAQSGVTDDAGLAAALTQHRLEWLEADIGQCASAMNHLENAAVIPFFATAPLPDDTVLPIVLHADKIAFDFRGGYLTSSSYYGYLKAGSPGEWAAQFARSLEECWVPASSPSPWAMLASAQPAP